MYGIDFGAMYRVRHGAHSIKCLLFILKFKYINNYVDHRKHSSSKIFFNLFIFIFLFPKGRWTLKKRSVNNSESLIFHMEY